MILFKNNKKKATLSFKVVGVVLLSKDTKSDHKYSKIVSLFTTIVLAMSGLVLSPANASLPEGGNATVNCGGGGTFTITNYVVISNNLCDGQAEIPSGVTSIADNAFLNATLLTSIFMIGFTDIGVGIGATIPIGVGCGISGNFTITNYVVISNNLCDGEAKIPGGVTSIADNAFSGNTLLTSVIIGNSVGSIGANTFLNNTALATVTFLRTAAPTVGVNPFSGVAVGATANVPYNATGFGANGSTWNDLIVSYRSAPADSSTPAVVTPVVEEAPAAEFNSKNRKYLSKRELKTMLDKKKIFKNYPINKYKYSIFGTSKKTCAIQGNFVVALKKTGACEMWVTRTTAKGAKYKYWVKINYSK
jgi:hypothetical protein